MVVIEWHLRADSHGGYGIHGDGPTKGYVAVHVSRPGGTRWRASIPRPDGPWVDLPICDTLVELEAQVVAWHTQNPHDPPPKPPPRKQWRLVANRPEPARWPKDARRSKGGARRRR